MNAAALAAVAALCAPVVSSSADPVPANPDGAAVGPGPANPAAPPPVGAVPPVDDGKVVSPAPATEAGDDGVTMTVSGGDEIQIPVYPLTTAISTREYDVGGVFRGSIAGAGGPSKGVLEVGYQIGCGMDMGTGPGVLIGGNLGANAIIGLILPGPLWPINGGLSYGGSVTAALKPGIVNTVPVTKHPFQGTAPRVTVRNFRVKIDGCVGESFIRSYAVLVRSTEKRNTILAWYGATKRV
jgi:hypothetical protein